MNRQACWRTQFGAACELADFPVHRVKATHQTHAQLDAVLGHCAQHGITSRQSRGHWFFAENMHAGFRSGQGWPFVQMRWGGDEHSIHVFARQHVSKVCFVIALDILCQRASLFLVNIADTNHAGTVKDTCALCETRAHIGATDNTQSQRFHNGSLVNCVVILTLSSCASFAMC